MEAATASQQQSQEKKMSTSRRASADDRRASRVEQIHQDSAVLENLGHSQELVRQFTPWSMFALAFTVLGTWSTLAQNLSTGLTAGGPVTILWGLVLVTICNMCVAASLGELLSAMPTALGQAFWVYHFWTTPMGRFASYMTAWINTFGWWTITASQAAFMTEFILAMNVLYVPDWAPASEGWVNFLLYVAIVLFLTVVNVVACRKDQVLPWINSFVGSTFILLFFVFALALLIGTGVRAGNTFQPASFVFGDWENQSGWPSGVIWFTGLVQSAYGLTAFDACIHMVEELPNASSTGPRIVWLSVLTGSISGFIFMMICLFSIQNIDDVVNADHPFIQLCVEAMGLTAAVVLLALFIISGIGQNLSLATTASRLTWSFARDGGVPFFSYFAKVDEYWRVPVRATWAQGFIAGLVGVLYLFADTVLEAILSVSTIALTISYAIPIIALLVAGRDKLPASRNFNMGWLGMPCNIVSIIYCCITTVFFFFPGAPNPSIADMNWAIAVFGVMLVISIGFWFVQGSRTYLRVDTANFGVLAGQMEGGRASLTKSRDNDELSKGAELGGGVKSL